MAILGIYVRFLGGIVWNRDFPPNEDTVDFAIDAVTASFCQRLTVTVAVGQVVGLQPCYIPR